MGQPTETGPGIAVVTGASSGIGAATARRLAGEGYHVIVAARRAERLGPLAQAITEAGGLATAVETDITDDRAVQTLADAVDELRTPLTVLVNNAGGAIGLDPVEAADLIGWQRMYEVNVLGTARVTKALLPRLEASGAGSIVVIGSTAGLAVYEGGAGYTAAKHAERAVAETLRLELCGRPIRVIEIDPGMVRTEEFSLNRFAGDMTKAEAVYQGVPDPLVAEDIADAVCWCVTRQHHVNIDRVVIRPLAQAANHKVHRV
jgi:NADP-dependent 3-hydroxy acid dehydrogenase YdfG